MLGMLKKGAICRRKILKKSYKSWIKILKKSHKFRIIILNKNDNRMEKILKNVIMPYILDYGGIFYAFF